MHSSGNAAPQKWIITHHKSGTHAARQLLTGCCEELLRTGLSWTTAAECSSRCARTQQLHASMDGLRGKDHAEEHIQRHLQHQRAVVAVHVIRNPVDVLSSGYLYHKRECERHFAYRNYTVGERWLWTMASRHGDPIRWPGQNRSLLDAALGRSSFCSRLVHGTHERGLEAEALRTLLSGDGIGGMGRDVAWFEHAALQWPTLRVRTVCLGQMDTPGSWGSLADEVGISANVTTLSSSFHEGRRVRFSTSTEAEAPENADVHLLARGVLERCMETVSIARAGAQSWQSDSDWLEAVRQLVNSSDCPGEASPPRTAALARVDAPEPGAWDTV